jgi:hypothetical protein
MSRAEGVAEVVKCLPSKHEAMSSNSSTATKTKDMVKKVKMAFVKSNKSVRGFYHFNIVM